MADAIRTLAIPIGFILMAGLICWHLVTAKARWHVRLAFIVVLPAFGLLVWNSMDSYRGWPAPVEPPQKAQFIWAVVEEPLPGERGSGSICLWLLSVRESRNQGGPLEYEAEEGEPRVYRAPYSRRLHQALQGAMRMVRKGRPVMFDRSEMGKWPPRDGDPGDEQPDGFGLSEHDSDAPRFYQMPSQSPYQKEDR